jgi:hypothetical protein
MGFFKKEDKKSVDKKEFVCKVPECTFSIPARPTVRQQMEYLSATAGASGDQMLFRFWEGAKVLIIDWKADCLPDFKKNVDEMDNPEQAELITWASLQVKMYFDNLENIPKN